MTSTKEALWLAERKRAARNRPRESSKFLLFQPLVKRGFLLSCQILTAAFVNAINIRLPDILW